MNTPYHEFLEDIARANFIIIGEEHSANGNRRIMRDNARLIVEHLTDMGKKVYFGIEHLPLGKSPEEILDELNKKKEIHRYEDYSCLYDAAANANQSGGLVFSFGGKNSNGPIKDIINRMRGKSVCALFVGDDHLKTSVGILGYFCKNEGSVLIRQRIDLNSPVICREPDYLKIKNYLIMGALCPIFQ